MIEHVELIERLEGFESTVYRCTAGFLSVGYGTNMEALGVRKMWDKLDIPEKFGDILNGSELSRSSAERLLEKQWKHAENLAKSRTRELGLNWNEFSEMKKFVLVDVGFNTGSCWQWKKVFIETEPEKVLFEARRKQREIDSRICKIAKYFGVCDTVEDCKTIGLTEAKYIS